MNIIAVARREEKMQALKEQIEAETSAEVLTVPIDLVENDAVCKNRNAVQYK